MIRILLPKPLDRMTERENKKYAKALQSLSHAIYVCGDKNVAVSIMKKFNLRIANGIQSETTA